jgi:hypothetical protein
MLGSDYPAQCAAPPFTAGGQGQHKVRVIRMDVPRDSSIALILGGVVAPRGLH